MKENGSQSPLGRSKGRQALGGCGVGNGPTPALRDRCRFAPPLQGGDFLQRNCLIAEFFEQGQSDIYESAGNVVERAVSSRVPSKSHKSLGRGSALADARATDLSLESVQ